MLKTGSEVLIFFIVLKEKLIFPGAIFSHAWLGLHKGGASWTQFFSRHAWLGVFSNNKRSSIQKKETFVNLISSMKINMITSFFSKFLVKFFSNRIKYVLSRAVLCTSGCSKCCIFESYKYSKHICRWFLLMKVKVNM